MLVYVTGMTVVLYQLNVWTPVLLKDTLLWFLFCSFAMMMRFVTSSANEDVFRSVLVDNAKISLVLEFVVNIYSFPIFVELILVPVMSIVVMTQAYTATNENYRPVQKLTEGILAITGLVLIYLSLDNGIRNYQELATVDTVRAVFLPAVFSIGFAPFIYIAVLVSTYEQVFLRLRFGDKKPPDVIRYARRSIFRKFGLDLSGLRSFLKSSAFNLIQIRTKDDINDVLNSQIDYGPLGSSESSAQVAGLNEDLP